MDRVSGAGANGGCYNCGGLSPKGTLPYGGGAKVKRYCSVRCQIETVGGKYKLKCKECGVDFQRNSKQGFCSYKCRDAGTYEIRNCATCKGEFQASIKKTANPNVRITGEFCSASCRELGQSAKMKGRFRVEFDYKQLDSLCKIHCTGAECAAILGVCYEALNKGIQADKGMTFPEYFEIKSADGKVSLRRRQFMAAMDGNPTMMIWLGKQLLGQEDKKTVDNTSSDGTMTPCLDVSKLSDDVLAQIMEAYDEKAKPG